MNRSFSYPFLVLLILGVILTPILVVKDHETELKNAATFLQNQFNETLNLCAEAPWACPNDYWLVEDNLLAYHAIKYYNETMATEIYSKLQEYGYMKNFACEALFNQTLELPFRHSNTYTIEEGAKYRIRINLYNGSPNEGWQNYSNLLCLAALSEYWRCNTSAAIRYFNQAAAMWDGTGIVDQAFKEGNSAGIYQTYKLALLLYAERIFGQVLAFHDAAETIIWQMQNRTNYGIHTGYNAEFDPTGTDVNIETTSLVIGAYKWSYTPSCPTFSPARTTSNEFTGTLAVCVVVMYIGTWLVTKGRRRRNTRKR